MTSKCVQLTCVMWATGGLVSKSGFLMSEASLQPFRTEGSIIVPWTSDQTAFKTPVVLDMLARMLELVTVASDKGLLAIAAVVAGCLSDVMFALFSGRLLISSATDFLTQASKVMRPHMDPETFKLMFLDVLREVYDDIYSAASSEKLDDVGRDPKKLLQTLQQRARTQLSAFLQALLSCHTIKRRDLFEVFDTATLDLVNLPFRGVQKWSTRVRTKVLYTLPVYTLFRENPRGYSEVLRRLTAALYADVRKPVDEALVSLISEESLCARRVMEICVVTVGSDWQAPNASYVLDRLLFRYEESLPEFVCRRLDLLQMHSDLCGHDGTPFAELERLSRRAVAQCVAGLLRVLSYLIQSGVVSLEAARKHVGPSLPVVAEMFGRLRVLTKSKEITSVDFAALLRQEHHERWPSGTVGLSSECLYSPQECEDGAAESAVESALPARRCVLLTRDPVTLSGAADTINLQDYLQYVNAAHIPLFMLIAALVDLGAWTQAEILWDEIVDTGAIPLLNQDVRDAMTRRFPLEVRQRGSSAALLTQTKLISWVTRRMRCHVGWSVPLLDAVAGLALELNSMEGLSILQMQVLPGCLCGPAVPAVVAKAWACLKTLPPRSRFETYTALIHHIDSDPLTAHFHSQARTSVSRILKRITSNGSSSHRSDLESALDNLGIKLPVSFKRSRLASQHEKDVLTTLCSLAILDPMATMEVVLRNVEWFDKNFGTTVVQSLKFIPDLTVDIGVMLMLDQVDGSEYQVGQPLPRKLVNCTHFASLFFRQFPRRVMSSFMHVVLRHLETAVGDLSFPQRIPSAMGDIHYFVAIFATVGGISPASIANLTVNLRSALAGGLVLRSVTVDGGGDLSKKAFRDARDLLKESLSEHNLYSRLVCLVARCQNKLRYDSCGASDYAARMRLIDDLNLLVLQVVDFAALTSVDTTSYSSMTPAVTTLFNNMHMHLACRILRPACASHPQWEEMMAPFHAARATFPGLRVSFVNLFWRLSLADVFCPTSLYQEQIDDTTQAIELVRAHEAKSRDRSRDAEKYRRALEDVKVKLQTELAARQKHVALVAKFIADCDRSEWFEPETPTHVAVASFLTCLVSRRVVASYEDALFCAKFIEILHSMVIPELNLRDVTTFWTSRITQRVNVCTENEADVLGAFCSEALTFASSQHPDLETCTLWEGNMFNALSRGLGLADLRWIDLSWTEVRCVVRFLTACEGAYPLTTKVGQILLKAIPSIVQGSKDKQWKDIHLNAKALQRNLEKHRTSWMAHPDICVDLKMAKPQISAPSIYGSTSESRAEKHDIRGDRISRSRSDGKDTAFSKKDNKPASPARRTERPVSEARRSDSKSESKSDDKSESVKRHPFETQSIESKRLKAEALKQLSQAKVSPDNGKRDRHITSDEGPPKKKARSSDTKSRLADRPLSDFCRRP